MKCLRMNFVVTIVAFLLLRVMAVGSVSVCVCLSVYIYKEKGTCLLHFNTSVPPSLIAYLNHFPSSVLPAHLPVFGADFMRPPRTDGGNWHGEYPITILVWVNTHHSRSKHNKLISIAAAKAHLLASRAFSEPLSQPVFQSAIQSSNQPASQTLSLPVSQSVS